MKLAQVISGKRVESPTLEKSQNVETNGTLTVRVETGGGFLIY